eukprot:CAMPEP_0198689002 /NCGR_PEP_ID=MMETSP1468-20131203/125544_1 /TAXON_ID=1461545 /ORGANISM="Mantoniella sp, Strain CCMP1436" /LENGTH=56 /DNA_ID=CAMNT_0044439505 /DNA_START=1448 /DNA_END=1618 /DNA_ORIENTATION=+
MASTCIAASLARSQCEVPVAAASTHLALPFTHLELSFSHKQDAVRACSSSPVSSFA